MDGRSRQRWKQGRRFGADNPYDPGQRTEVADAVIASAKRDSSMRILLALAVFSVLVMHSLAQAPPQSNGAGTVVEPAPRWPDDHVNLGSTADKKAIGKCVPASAVCRGLPTFRSSRGRERCINTEPPGRICILHSLVVNPRRDPRSSTLQALRSWKRRSLRAFLF